MIKVLARLGIQTIDLNIIKAPYTKPVAINLDREKLKNFHLNQEQDKDVHPLQTHSIQSRQSEENGLERGFHSLQWKVITGRRGKESSFICH